MDVVINGEPRWLDRGATIRDLLPEPAGHAVALNGAVVPRTQHGQIALNQGDVVEIVTAVQGG